MFLKSVLLLIFNLQLFVLLLILLNLILLKRLLTCSIMWIPLIQPISNILCFHLITRVFPSKVEIKLRKVEPLNWPSLEKSDGIV